MTAVRFRIQRRFIFEHTDRVFRAQYKGHRISIEREPPGSHHSFYITVTAPSGECCYDGWWGDPDHTYTMKDAIEQALRGSLLLERR